jgi:uncharacterized protein YcbK (DUF882 family)
MAAWGTFPGSLTAAGDTRTLSIYHVHTKESLTITYKKNGRYIPSALAKINYVLRDWRRNEVIPIDPKTIDLMWELHADLGSRAPIHIICGYRSASTNGMLKKIGRNVAKQSMHIRGKAIDLYFPDVPVAKLRGSAIVRQIGGVGYYPRSGTSGFVHLDSGKVRYWPRPSEAQLSQIMKDHKKTVGARLTNGYMVAQVDTGNADVVRASGKVKIAAAPPPPSDEEEAETAEAAVAASPGPEKIVASSYPIPKPRPKPIEVLMLAAAKMHVEPASAPPPARNNFAKRSSVTATPSPVASTQDDAFEFELTTTNALNKGSFAAHAQHEQTNLVTASLGSSSSADDFFWWPTRWLLNTGSIVRRESQHEPVNITFTEGAATGPAEAKPAPVQNANSVAWGLGDFIALLHGAKGSSAKGSAKADRLMVNRDGKADIAPSSELGPLGEYEPQDASASSIQ